MDSGELSRRGLAESGTRRIEYDQPRLFVTFLQEFFRVEVMRYHVQACRFRVGAQVADGSQIRVDGDHALEGSCQRQREKAHSGIEIERERALLFSDHALQKILNQESIHLKKRQMTDSKIEATGFVS